MKITDAISELRQHGGIIARASSCWLTVWVDNAGFVEPKLFQSVQDRARGFNAITRWKPTVEDLLADDWQIVESHERAAAQGAA